MDADGTEGTVEHTVEVAEHIAEVVAETIAGRSVERTADPAEKHSVPGLKVRHQKA